MSTINFSIEEIQNFYLKKKFLNNFYNYYVHNGYYNILSSQIVNILNNTFILFYYLILTKCVNWTSLLTLDEKTNIIKLINIDNIFKFNFYNLILFIIYIFYLFSKITNVLIDIQKYKTIKNFYNINLKINDDEITNLKTELEEERKTNFDLNKDISILNQKLNDERRHYHTNYQAPDGSDVKKKCYIIDVSRIKIPEINTKILFNHEYSNLFTYGHFHWALPKGKRVGDIVIIKDSHQGIDIMLRIFNTFPMTKYYPDYSYLGTVCMACIPVN